uniref:Response regulatory domain-containing protein n=1 Tax=Moniliophthora roreri TaxID=221103 RepID=A0A0W0FIB4_MONRR
MVETSSGMNSPKLSAVRLASANSEEKHLVHDGVLLDLPPSNKFSIQYSSQADSGLPIPTPPSSDGPAISSSESGETDFSADEESGQELEATDTFDTNHSPPISRLRPAVQGMNSSPLTQPRFSRAFSLPLPSQLGHLQHPHRPFTNSKTSKPQHTDPTSAPDMSQLRELSLELADSVQMVIQTMLQISPSQVLDPAKEQFAACALAVPTPSMSAMFTVMKNLNYISANMATFCGGLLEAEEEVVSFITSSGKHNDFDIGELLQSTGDALSGAASQVGVDLVLYHGDVGMKHVWVKGDESALSYLLSHVVRQILATAHRADTLEIGLFVRSPSSKQQDASITPETDDDDPFKVGPVDLQGPLQCTVEIHHRFGITEHPEGGNHVASRSSPSFSTLLLRRLLLNVGATLNTDITTQTGRTSQVTFTLEAGSPPIDTPATVTANGEGIGTEPSLEQLTTFVDTLKGKKVHLYASSSGSFAHRLTSYLTAWEMDVSHINAEGGIETLPEAHPPSPTAALSPETYAVSGVPTKTEPRQPKAQPLSFIFIDDDVSVLKERLQALRPETAPRKRPSLTAHHRPRSSPQVTRLSQQSPAAPPSYINPAVILHFTSLSNFKVTKDAVQSMLSSYQGTPFPVPEVMIIPKPAGPRRVLTALHSAVTKPVVDPFFSPIATTPGSPGALTTGGSFFHGVSANNSSPKSPSTAHRPSGSRSNSDRSAKIAVDGHGHPSSPLAIPDPSEYFTEPAINLGHSPSTGLVIQSPDGQPAGIFFHPKVKASASRTPSATYMERDKGQLSVGSGARKGSMSSGAGDGPTFSSLHEVNRAPSFSNNHAGSSGSRAGTRSKPSSPRVTETPAISLPLSEASSQPPSRRPSTDPPSRKLSTSVSPPASPAGEQSTHPNPVRRATARRDSNVIAPAQPTKKAKPPADPTVVPPISVLIVDDNPINRNVLSTFMRKKKIKYDVASNGKEAVEKWRSGQFHLILMDIVMPVMDGIDATIEIRRIEKQNANAGFPPSTPARELDEARAVQGPPTPSDTSETTRSTASPYRSSVIIVALTASSSQADRIKALAAGCNDFLTKPVYLEWLNNKLIEWGSIKALQMWADLVPRDVVRSQANQARNVAERLHVPRERNMSSSSAGGGMSTSPQAMSQSASQEAGKSPSRPTSPKTTISQAKMVVNWQQQIGAISPASSLSSGATPLAREQSQNGNADTRGDLDSAGASNTANGTALTIDSSEHSSPTSNEVEQDAQDKTNTPPPPVPSDPSVSTGAGEVTEEGVQQRHGHGNVETKAKAISGDAMDSSGEASGATVERGHDASNGDSNR